MSIVERAIKKLQSQQSAPLAEQQRSNVDMAARRRSSPPTEPLVPHGSSNGALQTPRSPAAPLAPAILRQPHKSIVFDRNALRAAGLMPPEHQERQIQNQYRQIKRPLIANALGKNAAAVANGHLIMVASAMPGEGKTFTSMNLALSMAVEKDISVLLVDADVAKPHISTMLGLHSEPGLLDALQNELLDVESLVIGTDVERLSILPAGRRNEAATELLASARMEEVVAQLARGDDHRIVLFDSPPLLLTSESRVLSTVVGQIVMVVRSGFTAQQAVLDAIGHLSEGKSTGIVLNQCDVEQESRYYYGYGSYGSSSGVDERETSEKQ